MPGATRTCAFLHLHVRLPACLRAFLRAGVRAARGGASAALSISKNGSLSTDNVNALAQIDIQVVDIVNNPVLELANGKVGI